MRVDPEEVSALCDALSGVLLYAVDSSPPGQCRSRPLGMSGLASCSPAPSADQKVNGSRVRRESQAILATCSN